MLSAKYYAQSTVAFEEVALKFVERDERDALRSYLLAKVDKLRKGVSISGMTGLRRLKVCVLIGPMLSHVGQDTKDNHLHMAC